MSHKIQKESTDIDNPGRKEGSSPFRPKESGIHLYSVSVNDPGEGLPYAPEDWPNPGDKWVWKVGKRITVSGFFMDRYLYLPSRFRQAGQGRCFACRLSLEQYVQRHFPDVDVDVFFLHLVGRSLLKHSREVFLLSLTMELEYILVEERLSIQKDNIINLNQQLDKERLELSLDAALKDQDSVLDSVLCRIKHIKRELSTLKDMEEVSKGFGRVPKHILEEQFGVGVEH